MKKFKKYQKFFLAKLALLNKKRRVILRKTFIFIQKKPFTSFFSVLAVFFVLMVLGNLLFAPKPESKNAQEAPKQVKIYKLGSAPLVSYQGKIEKSGVVKIVAQMPGIVSAINVTEGQKIDRGTNILSLSTNYQGGNALSLSRQIAQTQYQNVKDTFDTQKDVIAKQREQADKNKDNADLMRQITSQSAIDTQALFDLNKTIVDSLSQKIQSLEAINDPTVLQTKETLSQFQSAMVQTSSSYKSLQVQSSDNASVLASDSYQVALKQLDLQQKALETSLEVSRLSYNLALVNEANMYPSSPIAGTVDRVFVKVGDSISPGTTLASISGFNQHAQVLVSVTENIAKNISALEPSILYIGNEEIKMNPSYVSKDATNGVLYSVIYDLDDSLTSKLTNETYVSVKIPIGVGDTTNIDPFIPLDSVVQTQEEAFVYIADNKGIAKVKKITLGQIQGRFVEVLSGLPKEAQVILDRNVIEGDKVKVIR